MFHLRLAGAIAGFLAASVYGVAIALVRRDRSLVAHDYARMLARLMRPPLGITARVEGGENLLARRPCIYLANHQSAYEVPILAALYPPDTVVIGKRELRRIPFFGWLYRVTGNILIDRTDNPGSVGRLREAEAAILERGASVWIFPEGTRGTEPGRLLPFKKGAFYMAAATGAPLVPIVLEPVAPYFDLRLRRLRPAHLTIRVLAPILPAPGAEPDALLRTAQERMQKALEELPATRYPLPGKREAGSG